MEAIILIGIIIVLVVFKAFQTVSDGITQARIQNQIDNIRKKNIESSRQLWGNAYRGK